MAGLDVDRGRVREAKKKHERDATIAFWFHVDPTKIDALAKIGLLANLESVKAQQTIHLGQYDQTNYRYVFELYYRAFGDIELARKAQSESMDLYVEACTNANRDK